MWPERKVSNSLHTPLKKDSVAVGLVWRSLRAPKLKWLCLNRGKLGSPMCFRLAFSPVLCAADFVLSFSAFISFYAIGYTLCFASDCMFRSGWLKDAKFKSLVANDRTDWCLAKPKPKVSRLGHSQCLWHWQRYWQWLWQWICSNDVRIAISFSTSVSQCYCVWPWSLLYLIRICLEMLVLIRCDLWFLSRRSNGTWILTHVGLQNYI